MFGTKGQIPGTKPLPTIPPPKAPLPGKVQTPKAVEARYPCPEWIVAFLEYINGELSRVMWNRNQEEYNSPFENTGNHYENDVFRVRAYDWGYDSSITDWSESGSDGPPTSEPINFQWRDVYIYWYKWCGRGTYINQDISPEKGIQMLVECLASVRAEDTEF